MRILEFILKLNGKFSSLRNLSQPLVKKAILNPIWRRRLNEFYHNLSYYEKSIFHALYGRIFRDGKSYTIEGDWILKFAGEEIKIPLSSESLWLDWETAVSVLGHDYEVKAYYEEQITSSNPPKCFLDIGANYGTHSLLFLKCGARVISIEPNPECNAYFERLSNYNQVKGNWHQIALGEEKGTATIVFPEGETWLGSLKKIEFNDRTGKIHSYQVRVDTLDGFLNTIKINPDLVKIDTEGFEERVINGGNVHLSKNSVVVIFEANSNEEKKKLFNQFNELGYSITSLKTKLLIESFQFAFQKESNFLAIKV